MELEKIYACAGGNLEETMQRIPVKALLIKLVGMFVHDPSKNLLDEAIVQHDPEAAFRAVHTLKGVSMNLGFDTLSKACVALTEDLRAGDFRDGWEENYQALCKVHDQLLTVISEQES